jgi:hypothetical protein
MLAMGGSEAGLLVIAVAIIGWVRRRVIVELVRPLRLGPFLIRIRPEPHAGQVPIGVGRQRLKARDGG